MSDKATRFLIKPFCFLFIVLIFCSWHPISGDASRITDKQVAVRLVNASPGSGQLSVYYNNMMIANSLYPNTSRGYIPLPAGPAKTYALSEKIPAAHSLLFYSEEAFVPRNAYTVIFPDSRAQAEPIVLSDPLSTGHSERTYIRVVSAAATLDAFDAYINSYGETDAALEPLDFDLETGEASGFFGGERGPYQLVLKEYKSDEIIGRYLIQPDRDTRFVTLVAVAAPEEERGFRILTLNRS